jgi:pimeloyl-ACP methyl ester carboxylesterase
MAEKIPDAEIKILPDAGHIFPIEEPAGTVQAVHSFLSRNSS